MRRSSLPQADAALVLGAAVWPGEVPSPALERRARHACALYHRGQVRAIIATGGTGRHPPSEAEMIRRLCLAKAVPAAHILIEDRSTTTRENIAFALPIARAAGIATLLIVTDRYHAPRARLTARLEGWPARTACPPPGRLHPRLLRAWAREVPATLIYLLRHVAGR